MQYFKLYKKGGSMNNSTKFYPLTYNQELIWYTEKLYPSTSIGNNAGTLEIDGQADLLLLEQIINTLIKSNDGLRLRIIEGVEGPLQYVSEYKYYKVDFYEFSESTDQEDLDQWKERNNGIPFNLIDSDLFYFAIFKTTDQKSGIFIKAHHLIADAWSSVLLLNQVVETYFELKNKKEVSFENQPSYLEYITTEAEYKNSERFLENQRFWDSMFETIPEFIYLKTYKLNDNNIKARRKGLALSEKLTAEVCRFCSENKVSVFTVFMSLLAVYFSRITKKQDLALGTSLLNRTNAREKNTVGMFSNVVPVRLKVDCTMNFRTFVQLVTHDLKSILKNQRYPHNLILKDFRRKHKLNNIYDITLTYQNARLIKNENDSEEYQTTWQSYGYQTNSLNIHIDDRDNRGYFILNFDYLIEVFSDKEIQQIYHHLCTLLENALENPTQKLSQLEILPEEEKRLLLFNFNETKAWYPTGQTIHQLFEEQAAKTPDNIVLLFDEQQLTYEELNKKANQLARVLREKGTKPETIIGVLVKRSPEMIIAILSILKAGSAYLPLDPDYPQERIQHMLEESKTDILLTQSSFADHLSFRGKVIDLEDSRLYQGNDLNLENLNHPHDLAYVIYTSGSTGQAKGVLIEHKSLINYVYWRIKTYQFNPSDVTLQPLSFSFDGFGANLYSSILTGGKLVILDNHRWMDFEYIQSVIKEKKVTHMSIVPAMYRKILQVVTRESLQSLRLVVLAGEKSDKELLKLNDSFNLGIMLSNEYGPTENSITTTALLGMTDENVSVIGRPISNHRVYILDQYQNLLPIGCPGEMYVAGVGLARGYLHQPDLTGENFVPDPFIPGERMYRTGDMARWFPGGLVEFLGRKDQQVKLRGLRIELEEIEARLLEHEFIKQVVVIVRAFRNQNDNLYAYYVSEKEIPRLELRKFLAEKLPYYMIPSYFIKLESFPLTATGKIHRQALPEPDQNVNVENYLPPRNIVEKTMVSIWQEVLGVTRIGIDDNFFELGGDSIIAILFLSKLQRHHLVLELPDLFKHPTIGELSGIVKRNEREIDQGLVEGEIELSPVQRWFFHQNFQEPHHWNQALMLYKKDGFKEEIVRRVFAKIVEHHDALRMVFRTEEGKIVQFNRGLTGDLFHLKITQILWEENDCQQIEDEANQLQGSFDLENGPLVKLELFKTRTGDHLLIVVHHLIIDGVSWRIILEDFATGYHQVLNNLPITLPAKTNSFREWVTGLQAYAHQKELLQELGYWEKLLKMKTDVFPKETPVNKARMGDSITLDFGLSGEETEILLKNVNQAYSTEINDILLTGLGLALKEWTGGDRFLINLESHGREKIIADIDIKRTVGWFTAFYPVLLDMTKSQEMSVQIKQIKEEFRHIPNRGIGYGILKYIAPSEIGETLKFLRDPEICFNYLGQFDQDLNTELFQLSSLSTGIPVNPNSKRIFGLDINGMISGGQLRFYFNFHRNEYTKETIKKLMIIFSKRLREVINHCMKKEEPELTPTDFDDQELSLEELEEITKEVRNL